MRFQNKVCLIAGVASEIGEAVARRLTEEGGRVIGVDRAPSSHVERHLIADFTDEAQVAEAYDVVRREYGRLDVIYNNVGRQFQGLDTSALKTSLETWRAVHDVNLTSAFLSCKYGIPVMLETEPNGGSVVNAASFLADFGAATAMSAFAAAKAGVVQLSRDLAIHLARSKVRVNSVLFGPIQTPSQQAMFDRAPGSLERRMTHFPMGRFGTLDEAAGAVAFLASDDAGFITATSLALDGGATKAFTTPVAQKEHDDLDTAR